VGRATDGSIIRNIAVARRIATKLPPTGLVVQHGAIRWRDVRLGPGNSFNVKVAISRVIAAEGPGSATGQAAQACPTERAEVAPIVLEIVTFRGAEAGIEMLLAVAQGDTTAPTPALMGTVAPQA
jgi:hypothetical protein